MYLWSYLKTTFTDPGQIPVYWGFRKGASTDQRKRYCVICNHFKPDRAHHCSSCNVCVLNMDHHCPWLNSCIGFWNRKSFILTLIYLWFTVLMFNVSHWRRYVELVNVFMYFFRNFKPHPSYLGSDRGHTALVHFAIIISFFFLIILAKFSLFHIGLILENKTTIGNLSHQNQPY